MAVHRLGCSHSLGLFIPIYIFYARRPVHPFSAAPQIRPPPKCTGAFVLFTLTPPPFVDIPIDPRSAHNGFRSQTNARRRLQNVNYPSRKKKLEKGSADEIITHFIVPQFNEKIKSLFSGCFLEGGLH